MKLGGGDGGCGYASCGSGGCAGDSRRIGKCFMGKTCFNYLKDFWFLVLHIYISG